MKYEILDYKKYLKRIEDIINNPSNVNRVIKAGPLTYSSFGYPIDHFTIGSGDKHIIFMGGTHSNEIITIDFVTQLMEQIALANGIFSNLDLSEFTLDFIPLQNPEGFIISTSAIKSLITDDMNMDIIESICKKYEILYSFSDFIGNSYNPLPNKLKENILAHINSMGYQKMFSQFRLQNMDKEHNRLKLHLQLLEILYKYPKGTLALWQANGHGVNLNQNTPFSPRIAKMQDDEKNITYIPGRYNNIPSNVPSPIGVPCRDKKRFEFELENKALITLIEKLYGQDKFMALYTFHSTGGMIYHVPYKFEQHLEFGNMVAMYNRNLAEIYQASTEYIIDGIDCLEKPDISGVGDLLRSSYPGILLIELSKISGNPIGPYSSIENIIETFEKNMKAIGETIKYFQRTNLLIRKKPH